MKLYSPNDLKESRIFFDKQPPHFMTVFITFCILLALISSYFITKTSIVKVTGIVNTVDNRYVSLNKTGMITKIHQNEGEYVKKGDILFEISDGKENEQTSILNPQIKQLEMKLEALGIYDRSLKEKTNYLVNNGIQQTYYGKMEYYLSVSESEKFTKDNEKKNIQAIKEKIIIIEEEIDTLKRQLATISESENEIRAELKSKIETKESELSNKRDELSSSLNNARDPSSQAEQIYQQLLSEVGSERQTVNEQLSQLKGQMIASNENNEISEVKAMNEGYLHYLLPVKEGLGVQSAQTIAEISKTDSKDFIIEANINAIDISKIKIGQAVNVKVQGVNEQKYGTIYGVIESISSGTYTQETPEGNILYYQCRIKLNKTYLSSSNDRINLIKSMPVEAHIIYDKETYFEWILSLINWKD